MLVEPHLKIPRDGVHVGFDAGDHGGDPVGPLRAEVGNAAKALPTLKADSKVEIREVPRRYVFVDGEPKFKEKLVIADNVGVIANKVFALERPAFAVLWAGVFAFAIQIYADFSAYSDIARGAARWLGVDLMRNFNHPYLAVGPTDFWRRWHISLSSWFRDYVYIPLGGSRTTTARTGINVMITFLLSGFWHGASWNYVLWGGYHGLLLLAGRALAPLVPARATARRVLTPVRVVLMFALTSLGWLMFRETDVGYLWRDLHLSPMTGTPLDNRVGMYLFFLALMYSVPLWAHDIWTEYRQGRALGPETWRSGRQIVWDTAWCAVLVSVILVFRSRTSLDFIYFQF